ncbi:MAG: c-type cytochrome [Spongiibacteraceae bacterium]|nr:c-type cytochrome [Spongiibacteraceae bacterium]
MKKLILAAALSAAAAGTVQAQQAPVVGDAEAGRAKAEVCAACHSADGNSVVGMYPKIAGQSYKYAFKQLLDIKSGVRPVPVMEPIVAPMSEQDLADVAAFYASQKQTVAQADPELVERGATIYMGGIREKGVPACAACHAPNGSGNAPAGFPRLGGQHAEYLSTTLRAYRAGADGDPAGRANDGDTAQMRIIASRLSDSEIEALSNYISGLH